MTKDNYYNIENVDAEEGSKNKSSTPVEVEASSVDELPEGFENYEPVEIETPETEQEKLMKEIEESARKEGLANKPVLGGEGGDPESVISDLKKEYEKTSKIAKEKYEKHEEEKAERVVATLDFLVNQKNELIEIPVRDVSYDSKTGKLKKRDIIFMARNLTDKENTSLVNFDLGNKPMEEMTPYEREENLAYKRRFLAATIAEPRLTEEQWENNVKNSIVLSLFTRCQHILLNTDSSEIYKDFLN